MVIQPKLEVAVSQKLTLTPALQNAIKLLTLPKLELSAKLTQEISENPLLEEIPSDEEASDDSLAQLASEGNGDDFSHWDDADFENFSSEYEGGSIPGAGRAAENLAEIENTLTTNGSLSEHLLSQLSLRSADNESREIGTAIIGNLDSDGYLVASCEEIANMGSWSRVQVEHVLTIVQTFDPIGIAARSPEECLILQIPHCGLEGTISESIVSSPELFLLLQKHQFSELAKRLGISCEDVRQSVESLQQLDPKPGRRFDVALSQYVVPDVSIIKVEDEYVAVMNEDGMPQLRISSFYERMLRKESQHTAETRSYVREKIRSALWLLKAIDQRNRTIQKVVTSLIGFQKAFLDHGIEHLRPLVLKDVADDIEMHESTISRVVNSKFVDSPQGVFELRYFFHSGVHSSFGKVISSLRIKERIRKLIEGEDSKFPLSDSSVGLKLKGEGVVLARRTIAKYREGLGIPTSSQRKFHY